MLAEDSDRMSTELDEQRGLCLLALLKLFSLAHTFS